MKQPRGHREYGKEGCCPTEWNNVPDMTGDPYTDGSIMRCKNRDAAAKLEDHLTSDTAYDRNSAYHRSSRD